MRVFVLILAVLLAGGLAPAAASSDRDAQLARAVADFDKAGVLWEDARPNVLEPLLDEALTLRRRWLPANDPLVARTLSRLGALHYNMRDYPRAESDFRAALAIDMKTQGERDAVTMQAMGDLAAALREQHRYKEAEPIAERSLALRSTYRFFDPGLQAGAIDNLARIYLGERRLDDALALAERNVETLQAAHAPLAYVRRGDALLAQVQSAIDWERRLRALVEYGAMAVMLGGAFLLWGIDWVNRRFADEKGMGFKIPLALAWRFYFGVVIGFGTMAANYAAIMLWPGYIPGKLSTSVIGLLGATLAVTIVGFVMSAAQRALERRRREARWLDGARIS